MKRSRLRWSATVAVDDFQLGHRYVQFVPAVILKCEEFGLSVSQFHCGETGITADPVLHVYDRIARANLGQVAQHVFRRYAALAR